MNHNKERFRIDENTAVDVLYAVITCLYEQDDLE